MIMHVLISSLFIWLVVSSFIMLLCVLCHFKKNRSPFFLKFGSDIHNRRSNKLKV